MKLQKQIAYKYKDKEIYKHVVVIPEKVVESLDWEIGEELKGEINGRSLIIKPRELSQKVTTEK